MPSRNIVKAYVSDSFYHVYNRGVEKRNIFLDDQDYQVFLSLLKRYLSKSSSPLSLQAYRYFGEQLELLAFCLMPNHFHLFFFQHQETKAIIDFMRSVCTSYTLYFNKKYNRVGHLFQSHYKATIVSDDAYLLHITRYIHRNPGRLVFETYEWSSYQYFLGNKFAEWLRPQRILETFGAENYEDFVNDYDDFKETLDDFSLELANK